VEAGENRSRERTAYAAAAVSTGSAEPNTVYRLDSAPSTNSSIRVWDSTREYRSAAVAGLVWFAGGRVVYLFAPLPAPLENALRGEVFTTVSPNLAALGQGGKGV
jgi:hypothetical protein